ncbi:MAG: hypothetical protein AMXMBFR13_44210 [Phycisphaerae bacterium]
MNGKMERRSFLAGSLAAAGTAIGVSSATALAADEAAGPASGKRELYELRVYRMLRGPMLQRADGYFQNALLPALKRHGLGPVGVFTLMVGPDNPSYYVLIPHPSAESVVTLGSRLGADAQYKSAAADFGKAPATDPPYKMVESSLMLAADFMPKIEVPSGAANNSPRVFELRIYRSHSKTANRKKIEMFGPAGELAIFRRTGLQPVFFAETLIGSMLPNLTYMLVFPDMATRDKNWSTFVADPEWKKLSTTPGYTDPEIVAEITNVLLRPTAYSQI